MEKRKFTKSKMMSDLMDAIIIKAQEVKSECSKELPEMWKVCDLAIEDLERLFDEVHSCVFSCSGDTRESDTGLANSDVALLNDEVNTFSEYNNFISQSGDVNL